MSVKLRSKKTKDGRESLYLDIYKDGNREYNFLELYLFSRPKNESEKIHNSNVKAIAEKKRSNTETDLINSEWKSMGIKKTKLGFLEYFSQLTEQRKLSTGNYGNWDSTYKILVAYYNDRDKDISEITEADLNGIKKYITEIYRTKSNKLLSANAASSYFNKVKAALNKAFEEKHVDTKIGRNIQSLKPEDTNREFLTEEEVRCLVKTDCDNQMLKNAFLFSVFTGLRWSDIINIKWFEIQKTEDRHFLRYRQKKTGSMDTIDLNQNAIHFLGERMMNNQKVFKGLKYSAWLNAKLKFWTQDAGIKKHITFHCARHTFATLLLTKNVDIYTVSKLLGHKELKTTQVYAKVIDQRKIEAVKSIDFNI
jgi:integrase